MNNNYQNKNALLIGNGINLLDSRQSFSWGAILQELKNKFSIDIDLDNVCKPFPLAFDEMLHKKSGSNDFKDKIKTLKQGIRESIDNQLNGKRGFNEYHQSVTSLPYSDILTTNYDYSLQKSIKNDFILSKTSLANNRQERKFSLKRSYILNKKKIWHIHGELYDSRSQSPQSKYYSEESIMIGYEHYTSYLERIQSNIKGSRGTQKIENQSLMIRLRDQTTGAFWTDIFFTHNLDIIGQGFDFSENHLWWLINFRANSIRNTNSKYKVKINNQIRYFYPIINHEDTEYTNQCYNLNLFVKDKVDFQRSKAIADILKAFKVETIPIQSNSYKDFYDKFIKFIRNH